MELITTKPSQVFRFDSLEEIEDWIYKLQQRVNFIKKLHLSPP